MNQDNKTTQEQTYYAADPFCETPHDEQREQAAPAAMTETRQIVKPSATLFSKNHWETKNQGIYEDDC